MKEKSIKVIKISQSNISVIRIDNNLKSLQEQVEGYIEVFRIGKHDVICNEEGKIMQLEPNLYIINKGSLLEILCGNLIICNCDKNGEFASLKDEEIEELLNNKELMIRRIMEYEK